MTKMFSILFSISKSDKVQLSTAISIEFHSFHGILVSFILFAVEFHGKIIWKVCQLCFAVEIRGIPYISIPHSMEFHRIPWQITFCYGIGRDGVCERFLYNQKRNFSWIRQKTKKIPIDPHYKNCPLL